MSLVYQGDAIKGLGEFFPSIFIERVSVQDDYLDTQLAIYLPSFNDEPPSNEYLSDLQSKLNFYSILGLNKDNIQRVLDDSALIFEAWRPSSSFFQGSGTGYRYYEYVFNDQDLNLDFLSVQPEVIFDSSENMLFKYSFDVQILLAQGHTYWRAPQDWEEYFGEAGGYSSSEGKIEEDRYITLFCFATTYDLEEATTAWGDSARWIPGAYNSDAHDYGVPSEEKFGHTTFIPSEPLPLRRRKIGEITYEHIFQDGKVSTNPTVAYIDSAGVYFDDTPLMALDAKFYKPITITHEDIVDRLTLLLTSFVPDRESEIELSGVVDSISYALSVYGDQADFLYQLNKIRKAFPERGGATKTGRLYGEYSKAIAAINDKIKSNTEVKKQLYRNPTVVDNREPPALSSTFRPATRTDDLPAATAASGRDIIYVDKFLISREVYHAALGDDSTPHPAQALNWGYFFVDFEKVLHQDTDIAQVLSVAKLNKLFGIHLMNSAVKLFRVVLTRYDNNLDPQVKMDAVFGDPDLLAGVDWASYSEAQGYREKYAIDYGPSGMAYATEAIAGWAAYDWPMTQFVHWSDPESWKNEDNTELTSLLVANPGYGGAASGTSHLALRAWTPLSDDGLYSAALGHDYRLMCFEFEDYYEASFTTGTTDSLQAPVGEYYKVEVEIVDRSNLLLSSLKIALQNAVSALDDYYTMAADNCNYNNLGGYFNSFFVDYMDAQYASNLSEAPWNSIPSIYHMYLDLIDADESKTLGEILEAAALDSKKISPSAGTLIEVEAFRTKLSALNTVFQAGWPPDYSTWTQNEQVQYASWGRTLSYDYLIGEAVQSAPVYVSAEPQWEYMDTNADYHFAWRSGDDYGMTYFGTNWGSRDVSFLENMMNSWDFGTASIDGEVGKIETVIDKINAFFEANDSGGGHGTVSATKYVETDRKNESPSYSGTDSDGEPKWVGPGPKMNDVRVKAIMWENPNKASGWPSQYLEVSGLSNIVGNSVRNEGGAACVFVWLEYYDRIS